MPLIYITGISGSGKSTVRHELLARGYTAYDVDENGFRSWYNKTKGTKATEQKGWNETTVDWRKFCWLRLERAKVQELADRAKAEDNIIFLCGTTPNDDEVWDLLNKVISLSVSERTLRHRLAHRENDYGKHPDDLKDILGWNATFDKRMTEQGAIVVSAEQPLSAVVDEVLVIAGITYETIGRSKNGIDVICDRRYSHAATHLDDTPELKDLVAEVVSEMDLHGQEVATDVDMGRLIGTCDVVGVDDTDEVVYAKRKNREADGLVPFTKTRKPEPCRYVSVQLTPKTTGSYELASAWIGEWDDEPFPASPQATDKSIDYWNHHAFVWGSQEIIPGSDITNCS